MSLDRILDDRQRHLAASVENELTQLLGVLARSAADRRDTKTVETALAQLSELFLLVVVGEFNAGKSTFINALLGSELLEEGVTPTTSRVQRLKHGETREAAVAGDGIFERSAPFGLLRDVSIVDTPGTNALEREHERLTRDFVPRADLVLFVTSADRPFTESERQFIEAIREWGKKLVLVINKIDILRSEAEVDQVTGFVRDSAVGLLGFEPDLFPIAARKALDAKLDEQGSGGHDSRFAALENYVVNTLDEAERVRLKLSSPLGVGLKMAAKYLTAVDGGLGLLADDVAALDDIERQLELYKEDLGRQFEFRLADLDNILHEFEHRGDEFFEETFRLPRAVDLLNKARVQAEFERYVIADAPQRIESKVDEIIDWMIGAELEQWKAVTARLEQRTGQHADRLIGSLGSFEYDRGQLLETVGRAARRSVDAFDRRREARRLAESVQTAVAGAALMEVSAIGLGAVVTMMATTQLADVTGILAASTLAVLGLFVLPARRRKAKRQLSAKIAGLREQLMGALRAEFGREVERSVERTREAFAPYTRFVRAERERLEGARDELEARVTAFEDLRARVEAL